MDVSSFVLAFSNVLCTRGWSRLIHTSILTDVIVLCTSRPYITGQSLWRQDEHKGDYHMDGAFTVPAHPRCKQKLGLPLRIDLWSYILSPALQRQKALEFYELGHTHEYKQIHK